VAAGAGVEVSRAALEAAFGVPQAVRRHRPFEPLRLSFWAKWAMCSDVGDSRTVHGRAGR
jgi:hypothetical protein